KIAFFYTVEEVSLCTFAVVRNRLCRFFIAHILDPLLTYKVEFNPGTLVGCIVHAERVAAESVHMAHSTRDATLAHHDSNLVQRFGKGSPEIPVILRAPKVGTR